MFHDVQRYVVTAAHCLYNGNTEMTLKGGAKFRVMVGEHDHCKHNEVRTSSNNKQTNKQTNKNYHSTNNKQVMVGEHDQNKHNEVSHRTMHIEYHQTTNQYQTTTTITKMTSSNNKRLSQP